MNQLGPHESTIAEGLRLAYEGLDLHQLAMYHGVTREHAKEIKEKKLLEIPADWVFQNVFVQGGFGSGKTYADIVGVAAASIVNSDHWSLVVRKHHGEMKITYLAEFLEFIDKITAGNRDWLILDRTNDDGLVVLDVRSVGKPSKVIFKIEPDGDAARIIATFKGLQINRFTGEEASALKWDSIVQMVMRTRRPGPWRGTLLTNPDFDHTRIAHEFERAQKELLSGGRPAWLPIECDTRENTHLPPEYEAQIREQFANDPIGLSMALEGKTGIKIDGRPVFEGFFNEKKHVRADIKYDWENQLFRSWDFGKRVPAVGWYQLTKSGRAEKIAELIDEGAYIDQLADDVVAFTAQHFSRVVKPIWDFGDYAGLQKKDLGQSIAFIRKRVGISIQTKAFGAVEPGIDNICKLLSETRDNGIFRYTIHPRCKQTIMAYRGGYHRKVYRDERVAATPEKDGWYDNIVDTDRYGLCHVFPYGRNQKDELSGMRAKGMTDVRRARVAKTLDDFLKGEKQTTANPQEGTIYNAMDSILEGEL